MNADPNEIHFECPKCKRPMSGDKELLLVEITCPDCSERFYPSPKQPEPTASPTPEATISETKLVCPKCSAQWWGVTTLPGAKVACPACQNIFCPPPRSVTVKKSVQSGVEKLREQADRFTDWAKFVAACGVLGVLISVLIAMAENENAFKFFLGSVSLFGAASWLFLVGQIIHIRANTEK